MQGITIRGVRLAVIIGVSTVPALTAQAQPRESSAQLTASVLAGLHTSTGHPSPGGRVVAGGGVVVLSLRGPVEPQTVTVWARSSGVTLFEIVMPAAQQASGNRTLMDVLHDEPRMIATLLALWNLTADPSDSPEEKWQALAREADQNGRRHTLIRTTLTPGTDPRVVGYIVERPSGLHGRVTDEIHVAFDMAAPERLTITSDVTAPSSLFRRAGESFADFLGILGGALVTLAVFVLQQRYSRRADTEKQFALKKIEMSQKIRGFLGPAGNYVTLRDAAGQPALQRARNIRDTLIDEGIYATLPPADARALNTICSGKDGDGEHALRGLEELMHRRFGEFME